MDNSFHRRIIVRRVRSGDGIYRRPSGAKKQGPALPARLRKRVVSPIAELVFLDEGQRVLKQWGGHENQSIVLSMGRPCSGSETAFRGVRDVIRGAAAGLVALILAGCGGGGSGGGNAAAVATPGSSTTDTAALAASTALTTTITGVTINGPPVVNFTVTNQAGVGMAGLAATDLLSTSPSWCRDPTAAPAPGRTISTLQ